jgi:hypothetical protein
MRFRINLSSLAAPIDFRIKLSKNWLPKQLPVFLGRENLRRALIAVNK